MAIRMNNLPAMVNDVDPVGGQVLKHFVAKTKPERTGNPAYHLYE
jgi:hypothetical protein